MNQKQRERWRKIRTKGKHRYILIDGVLMWGFCFGILGRFIVSWFEGKPYNTSDFAIRFIMFSILGSLFALRMWKKQEKKYLEFQEVENANVDE